MIVYLLIAVVVIVAVWFVVALTQFLTTPKNETEKRKKYKLLAVIPGVILGVMAAAIVALAILFSIALTHM